MPVSTQVWLARFELEDMVGVVGGAQAAPPDAVVPPQLASGFSPVGVELHDEPNWKSR